MLEINLRSLYSQLFVYLCINPGINKLVVSGKPSDHCDLRIQCNSLHGECNHQILKIDQILSNIEDRSNIGECNHQACNCNLNTLTPVPTRAGLMAPNFPMAMATHRVLSQFHPRIHRVSRRYMPGPYHMPLNRNSSPLYVQLLCLIHAIDR
jgi:hypothetical protein